MRSHTVVREIWTHDSLYVYMYIYKQVFWDSTVTFDLQPIQQHVFQEVRKSYWKHLALKIHVLWCRRAEYMKDLFTCIHISLWLSIVIYYLQLEVDLLVPEWKDTHRKYSLRHFAQEGFKVPFVWASFCVINFLFFPLFIFSLWVN